MQSRTGSQVWHWVAGSRSRGFAESQHIAQASRLGGGGEALAGLARFTRADTTRRWWHGKGIAQAGVAQAGVAQAGVTQASVAQAAVAQAGVA